MTIETLIARFGLAAIFVGAGIEGETIVVTGGVLAHDGLLPLAGVAVSAAIGSFVADQIFFAIGRRYREHPRVKRIERKPAYGKAMRLFERYPTAFVFGFRFLYGLRTVSPMAIGTTGIAAGRFAALNLAAAALWATVFASAGYVFADGIERLFGRIRSAEHIMIGMLVAALVVVGLMHLWRRRAQ